MWVRAQVSFYTSREDNAALKGATHVVFLLTGMEASLGPVEVPRSTGAAFSKGAITDFDARADDLGELVKLQVWLVEKSGLVRAQQPPLLQLVHTSSYLTALQGEAMGVWSMKLSSSCSEAQRNVCLRPCADVGVLLFFGISVIMSPWRFWARVCAVASLRP